MVGSDGACGRRLTHQELSDQADAAHDARIRSQTAPEKLVRKNWLAASVNIKTARGPKVRVRAPGQWSLAGGCFSLCLCEDCILCRHVIIIIIIIIIIPDLFDLDWPGSYIG